MNFSHVVQTLRTRLVRVMARRLSREQELRGRIKLRLRELGKVYYDGNSDLIGHTYHPIPVAGFDGVKAHREASERRLASILASVDLREGDWVLDVGANVGFFAFNLAARGARVECYEPESNTFEIGAALSQLQDSNVVYINKPMNLRNLCLLRDHYRATLVLSVFHWIIKSTSLDEAGQVLRELLRRSDVLFFEVPELTGDGQHEVEAFKTEQGAEKYLQETLSGATATRLLTDEAWGRRSLYRITK